MLSATCHCGRVRIEVPRRPRSLTNCNCSICRRTGVLWHYSAPAQVRVTGEVAGYVQGDRMLTLWHCPTCGCVTHWTAVDPDYPRMGVNLRMFEPALWEGLPRRLIDGASF